MAATAEMAEMTISRQFQDGGTDDAQREEVRWRRDITEISPRYHRDITEISSRSGRDMAEMWPIYGRDMAEIAYSIVSLYV